MIEEHGSAEDHARLNARAVADACEAALATPPEAEIPSEGGAVRVVCVPNVAKSIASYLHQHWNDDPTRRFREPCDPDTLRRWRARRKHDPPA